MRRVLLALLFVAILTSFACPASADERRDRYYPETGHTLASQFVDFFDTHGGPEILGYPITDAFIDPSSSWLVQYTENARLELVPELRGRSFSIRLARLGEALGLGEPVSLARGPARSSWVPGCRFYPETGHQVCHAFLAFYLEHGGPGVFGYPLSEFSLEADRMVQYFQGFRLDWRPDERGGGVRVGPLGRIHFDRMGYDPALLRPTFPSDPQFYRVVTLHPLASVWRPVTGVNDSQQVYVVVRDQNAQPIAGASVVLFARFPGMEQTVIMPVTDGNGLSQLTLTFEGVPPGSSVELEVVVRYSGLRATTRDSFRVWW